SEAALRTQHAVVARIADRVDAILPARFGSVVDVQELDRVVALRRGVIADALLLVRGRTQMTIRVGRRQSPGAGPQSDSRRPKIAPDSGTAYLRDRRAAAIIDAPPDIVDPIRTATEQIVVATRMGPGVGTSVLTCYHLIERDDVQKYRTSIADA